MKANKLLLAAILASAIGAPIVAFAEDRSVPPPMASAAVQVHYQTAKIDGVDVFYREAGPKNAPVVLLLHGFPTSSQMFRDLIPRLADKYHVIAPDYPSLRCSTLKLIRKPSLQPLSFR